MTQSLTEHVRPASSASRELAGELAAISTAVASQVLAVEVQDGGTASWVGQVEDASRGLLLELARAIRHRPPNIVVVVRRPYTESPFSSALLEAVRGSVGAAALEVAPSGIRVNTIVVGPDTPRGDITATLSYLDDDRCAGFTTGAAIDLAKRTSEKAVSHEQPVLVTGATGGLGGAAVRAFLAAGRRVVATDVDEAALARLADETRVPTIVCDVTEPSGVADLAGHPLIRSGLSALVIHHGVGGAGALDFLPDDVRDKSLRVNGTGVWNVLDALLPALRRGAPGSAVVLASQAGLYAEPDNSAYCAAKFAVVGLVRALARQNHPDELRVHAICPGPVDTRLMREAFAAMGAAVGISAEEYLRRRQAKIPLGRFGQPDQIGAAAMYLCGLRSTGVVLAPTGGAVLT